MFQRFWWQPVSWVLSQHAWSEPAAEGVNVLKRRQSSISFLELARITDILTGGAFGPHGSSFAQKTALVTYAVKELFKIVKVAEENGTESSAKKAFRYLKDVPTAAACGFSAFEGLNRRLQYAADKKLAEAVGILVCYAHSAEGKLCAPLPRYTWYTVRWVPCQLENTLAQIAAKRCGEAECVDVLPVKLREGSLKLQTVTQAPKNKDTCAPAVSQGGRKGPCIFGCQATYKNHHGREYWKAVPSPSPWMGTAVGATLCGKCYN